MAVLAVRVKGGRASGAENNAEAPLPPPPPLSPPPRQRGPDCAGEGARFTHTAAPLGGTRLLAQAPMCSVLTGGENKHQLQQKALRYVHP